MAQNHWEEIGPCGGRGWRERGWAVGGGREGEEVEVGSIENVNNSTTLDRRHGAGDGARHAGHAGVRLAGECVWGGCVGVGMGMGIDE